MKKIVSIAALLATLPLATSGYTKHMPTPASVLVVDTEEIPTDFANCKPGPSTAPNHMKTVRMKFRNLLDYLGNGGTRRPIDYSEDDETDPEPSSPVPVPYPTAGSAWPTELDVELTAPDHFKGDKVIALRIMLLKSVEDPKGTTTKFNQNVDFLVPSLGALDSKWAVRRAKDSPRTVCARSMIGTITLPKPKPPGAPLTYPQKTFQYVDVYIRKLNTQYEPRDESLNIGFLIAPPPAHPNDPPPLKRLPIFIDPKVHNDGYP